MKELGPKAFLLMIFRMLMLLRWNTFGPRSLEKKITSKAINVEMSRVLGFATDWFRSNICARNFAIQCNFSKDKDLVGESSDVKSMLNSLTTA